MISSWLSEDRIKFTDFELGFGLEIDRFRGDGFCQVNAKE